MLKKIMENLLGMLILYFLFFKIVPFIYQIVMSSGSFSPIKYLLSFMVLLILAFGLSEILDF